MTQAQKRDQERRAARVYWNTMADISRRNMQGQQRTVERQQERDRQNVLRLTQPNQPQNWRNR